MNRPHLLDLFCGGGGAAMGYYRAGFDVTGVDVNPQPRYPFRFIQSEALCFLKIHGHEYDVIHASPPCQKYSPLARLSPEKTYPDLIASSRQLLEKTGKVWVIENVVGAPLRQGIVLCGSSFGLDVRRHRVFESSVLLFGKPCEHHLQTPRFLNTGTRRRAVLSSVVGVYGGGHFKGDSLEYRSRAMGIDWMTRDELSQAIPPSYTSHLGRQLINALGLDPEEVQRQ